MQTLALFVFAVISALTIVEAFKCHTCFSVEDEGLAANLTKVKVLGKNSKDCEKAPDSLQDVKNEKLACATATGTLTTGQTFLIRAGMTGPRENKCEDGANGKTVMSKLLDEGESDVDEEGRDFYGKIKEIKVCFCPTDGCNDGKLGSGNPGASGMTLILNPVFMIFALIGLTPSFFGLW